MNATIRMNDFSRQCVFDICKEMDAYLNFMSENWLLYYLHHIPADDYLLPAQYEALYDTMGFYRIVVPDEVMDLFYSFFESVDLGWASNFPYEYFGSREQGSGFIESELSTLQDNDLLEACKRAKSCQEIRNEYRRFLMEHIKPLLI